MTRRVTIAAIMYVAFILNAFFPLYAQEKEEAAAVAQEAAVSEETAAAKKPAAAQGTGDPVSGLVNKIIGYLAQIGNLFGDTTGVRIGGTTGSAIAALLAAKFIGDKMPSFLKWFLYLGGGTMLAGGGANIAQLIKQSLPGIIP